MSESTETESTESKEPRVVSEVEQRATVVVGGLVLILGLIGLALSFRAVSNEFRPEFGLASWAIPVGADVGIFAFSGLSILFALRNIPVRWVRFVPMALTAATVWFNIASATNWTARGAHALMPTLWVLAVEVCDGAIRHQMNLIKGKQMDKIRKARWLLSPVSTFRLWRRMRLEEITSFKRVLALDAARAVVIGRMRLLYGRGWRSKAPLQERIALRLQGRGSAGVPEALQRHQDTANLLAGSAVPEAPEAVTESAPEALPEVLPVVEEIAAQPATAPIPPARRNTASPNAGKRQVPGAGRIRRSASGSAPGDDAELTEGQLADAAEEMERAALEASEDRKGTSYRAVADTHHVGYPKAKTALDTARERIAREQAQPAIETTPLHLVERVNGEAVAA